MDFFPKVSLGVLAGPSADYVIISIKSARLAIIGDTMPKIGANWSEMGSKWVDMASNLSQQCSKRVETASRCSQTAPLCVNAAESSLRALGAVEYWVGGSRPKANTPVLPITFGARLELVLELRIRPPRITN